MIEDAAQAAGSVLPGRPSRRAGQHRDVQLLPVQEPRRLRRRRRDHGARRRRARRSRPDAALPRLLGQGHLRARGLQLAPGRAAGRDPARAAAAPRRLGRRPPRRRRGTTRRPGSASSSSCPRPSTARGRPGTSTWSAATRADELAAALDGGRPRAQGLLPHPGARAAGDARVRGRRRAARDRRGRAHAPRDPDEPRAHRRAGRRGDRDGRARWTWPPDDDRPAAARRRRRSGLLGPEPRAQLRRAAGAPSWPGAATRPRRCASASRPAFPGTRFTADLDEVLADDTLDAVALATPVPTHAALAQRVLAAGKHCFVEKPMAQSVADAEAVVAAARRRGPRADGRPPARVPPRRRQAEGADRRRGAGPRRATSTATA